MVAETQTYSNHSPHLPGAGGEDAMKKQTTDAVVQLVRVVEEYIQYANKPPWESASFDHDAWLKQLIHAVQQIKRIGGNDEALY